MTHNHAVQLDAYILHVDVLDIKRGMLLFMDEYTLKGLQKCTHAYVHLPSYPPTNIIRELFAYNAAAYWPVPKKKFNGNDTS